MKAGIAMSIGERIKYFRNLRGMAQKWLGMAVGFDENTADVRIAQYETGARSPREGVLSGIAAVLGVSPAALDVLKIDSLTGLAHTFFS